MRGFANKNSFPPEEKETLQKWMKEWTEYLLTGFYCFSPFYFLFYFLFFSLLGSVSYGMVDETNRVTAFCISEKFPSTLEFVDNYPDTSKYSRLLLFFIFFFL